jgi:hypothetical protein
MDDMQVLHRQEGGDAHPVGDFKRDQAVSETLLALKLWRNQRAAGERLRNTLGILEGLDAAEYRAGAGRGECCGFHQYISISVVCVAASPVIHAGRLIGSIRSL